MNAVDDRGNPAWRIALRVSYGLIRLLDPLIRSYLELGLPGLEPIVELRIRGRRTGRERRVLVTLLPLDGRVYVGHPNGSASWIRNLEATGEGVLVIHGESPTSVMATPLPPGDERTAVIRATSALQPFPANLLYRAARGHILRVGRYLRLEATRDRPTVRERLAGTTCEWDHPCTPPAPSTRRRVRPEP